MASTIAANRLRKELTKLKSDPPPGIIAEPKESDILTWFYALRGPSETPYEGGVYIGKLKFPNEYPMKPPAILMLTPSGRFEINKSLCMSMSEWHPESWNPLWSVASILQGVVSFMTSEEMTTGGIKATDSERKKLAKLSQQYNAKNYSHLFEGDIEAAFEEAEEVRQAAETAKAGEQTGGTNNSNTGRTRGGRRRVLAGPRKSRNRNSSSHDETKEENDKVDDEEEQEETNDEDNSEQQTQKELTPEEIEKRRKKNAKKRAKQKAKKAAVAKEEGEDDNAEG